jgi:hypothetical protein
MTTTTLNSLARASSAYLRSAMHQPIQWHEWGEEAFAAAQRDNKPVLLDVGAVWCHWCHVMDRESYDDPAVAAMSAPILTVAIKPRLAPSADRAAGRSQHFSLLMASRFTAALIFLRPMATDAPASSGSC